MAKLKSKERININWMYSKNKFNKIDSSLLLTYVFLNQSNSDLTKCNARIYINPECN